MTRGERRRLEREIAATKTAPGVGKGWRLSQGWRRVRYPVREHEHPWTVESLERESDEARAWLIARGEKVPS